MPNNFSPVSNRVCEYCYEPLDHNDHPNKCVHCAQAIGYGLMKALDKENLGQEDIT
jgi:hypothetical protein